MEYYENININKQEQEINMVDSEKIGNKIRNLFRKYKKEERVAPK